MATINLKGNPMNTIGNLPVPGSKAPAFNLVKTDLSTITLDELKGKRVLLNIFPSLDTEPCATTVRQFNKAAGDYPNTIVVCISKDLPFAHKRFCTTDGLNNVVPASDFRDGSFGKDYGVTITEGPMAGLLSRSVVVLNEDGEVIYNEQVSDLVQEPDYNAALAALVIQS